MLDSDVLSVLAAPEPERPAGCGTLVTVVTVVLNDAAGFQRTAHSVLSQLDVDVDWVVVDGGSTDGTLAIIEALASRIAHWSSEPDAGVYDAMNKGVAAASGDYVSFMNAGDCYAGPTSLARLAGATVDTRPAMVCGGARFRYPSGVSLRRRPRSIERCIRHQSPCSHQAMLTRADLLRRFPFDRQFQIAADYALVCRLFTRGERFVLIDKVVVVTPHGGTSLSYRRAWLSLREKMAIQRTILNLGPIRVGVSALHRACTIAAEGALSQRLLSR